MDIEEYINLFDTYTFEVQNFIRLQINNTITNPGSQTKAGPKGSCGSTKAVQNTVLLTFYLWASGFAHLRYPEGKTGLQPIFGSNSV